MATNSKGTEEGHATAMQFLIYLLQPVLRTLILRCICNQGSSLIHEWYSLPAGEQNLSVLKDSKPGLLKEYHQRFVQRFQ